jgi:hypothetical protein
MSGGINDRYLKELQQVLEAEAELSRQGSDLLLDPEYRALRELFIDGDVPLSEFLSRLEALAASRPDDVAESSTSDDDDDEDDDEDEDDD